MGLWHIDTLDFGNIQNCESASARIAVLGFLPDSGFLPSRTGSRAAAPACVIGFCRHFLTPFLEKNEQPQPAAFNYPFDFAFFTHATPRPFPRGRAAEILTAPGSVIMPSVTTLGVYLGMAGMAEGHQVFVSVAAALSQRLDVMYLLRLCKPAFLLAALTKRVCIHVPVTDAFPRPSIFSFDCWVPAILFITLVLQFLMLLAEPPICQLGTAGVGTRPLRFSWHRLTSLSGQKESPAGLLPQGSFLVLFF